MALRFKRKTRYETPERRNEALPSVRRDTTAMWSSPVPGFALFSHATFPCDTAPGYLLRVEAMGITQVVTAPRSPRDLRKPGPP